ncbi:MAG: hypothetical protein VYD64_05025 [Pseudomonadota bacterium]|nr:hypothetical protein [Pseudomonadota bacterium]
MPQLIALGLVGVLGWYAWRALKREMSRVGNELKRDEVKRESQPTVLERGEDGVYRPKE